MGSLTYSTQNSLLEAQLGSRSWNEKWREWIDLTNGAIFSFQKIMAQQLARPQSLRNAQCHLPRVRLKTPKQRNRNQNTRTEFYPALIFQMHFKVWFQITVKVRVFGCCSIVLISDNHRRPLPPPLSCFVLLIILLFPFFFLRSADLPY